MASPMKPILMRHFLVLKIRIDMMTREQQQQKIQNIEEDRIFAEYYLDGLEKRVAKGDDKIRVLLSLLRQEINRHNGNISKKANRIRNQPTL